MLVGQGVRAGIDTLHTVPQQAVGHMLGGAGCSHLHKHEQEAAAGDSPHAGAVGNSPHEEAAANSPNKEADGISPRMGADHRRPIQKRQHAAMVKQQHRAEARKHESEHSLQHKDHAGTPAPDDTAATGDSKPEEQHGGQSASGWGRVRRVMWGSAIPAKAPKDSVTAALESTSLPSEGNPDTRELKHSDSSSGSMSKNTTGPLQYIYSRGGKLAAVLALLGSKGKGKQEESSEGSSETQPAAGVTQRDDSSPCEITSPGAENRAGDDPISKFGASQPEQAAGSLEVMDPCPVDEGSSEFLG